MVDPYKPVSSGTPVDKSKGPGKYTAVEIKKDGSTQQQTPPAAKSADLTAITTKLDEMAKALSDADKRIAALEQLAAASKKAPEEAKK